MVEHLVLFKWKPETAPEAIDAAAQGLKALKHRIPGIIDLTCGDNFSDRSQGYDFGLVVRFTNQEALDAYGPHPSHQEVVQALILPIREDVIVIDYEIDLPHD
jgi:hypothetical protein